MNSPIRHMLATLSISIPLLVLGAARGASAGCYSVTDLGALAPYHINASRHVVGSYINPDGLQHGFLWIDGVTRDLGTLGGHFSYAQSLNASDQIVGWSYPGGPTGDHAFLWENGAMTDLGTFGGDNSFAWDINDHGVVVGSAEDASGTRRAFLLRSGTKQDLGTLGGSRSEARAINDRSQVVGDANTAGDAERHAFLWQAGRGMTDLGTLGGSTSHAYAINALGQVAGTAAVAADADLHAFFWEDGAMTDLGTLGGTQSVARGLNRQGVVVGRADTIVPGLGEPRAFVWRDGTMTDLNTLLPAGAGWTLLDANAIDDSGRIVGTGLRGDTASGFLLTPAGSCPSVLAVVSTGVTPDGSGIAADPVTHRVAWPAHAGSAEMLALYDGVFSTVATGVSFPRNEGPLGSLLGNVAADPLRGRVYLAGITASHTPVLGTLDAAGAFTTTPDGLEPTSMSFDARDDLLWLTGLTPSTNVRTLARIDPGTYAITSRPLPIEAVGMAADGGRNRLYIAGLDSISGQRELMEVQTRNWNTRVAPLPSGLAPVAVALNPGTRQIYVACRQALVVVDAGSLRMTTVPMPDFTPAGIAVDAVTNRVYVAGTSLQAGVPVPTLEVLDGASQTLGAPLALASAPYGVAVDEGAARVYVSGNEVLMVIAEDAP